MTYLCAKNYARGVRDLDKCLYVHINNAWPALSMIGNHDGVHTLVTSGGDWPINEERRGWMPPNLKAWWSTNVFVDDPRIHALPLGIGSDATYGKFEVLEANMNRPKDRDSIFVCFAVGNNPVERQLACEAVLKLNNITFLPFSDNENKLMPHKQFIEKMAGHEFVLAPPGNMEADTHRTWESLYLGCIPVCKRSPVLRWFTDLPILMLDSWAELTQSRLDQARDELAPKWANCATMLTMEYWVKKIKGSA